MAAARKTGYAAPINERSPSPTVRALALPLALTLAVRCAGGPEAVATSLDAGGQRVTGAGYVLDGSLGGLSGTATNGPTVTLKSGFIGQLTEVTRLTVLASPARVNEGGSIQVHASAGLDDATETPLAANEVCWLSPAYPIREISADGLADTWPVLSNTWGLVAGSYQAETGTSAVLIWDSDPDNFGLYSGDHVPDAWQAAYFGVDNPDGMGSATNATGQDNHFAYVADLDPTNALSCFKVVSVAHLPAAQAICFSNASPARVYRLLYAQSLASGAWTNLPGAAWQPGVSGQMTLLDTNTTPTRFYRVQVALPDAE